MQASSYISPAAPRQESRRCLCQFVLSSIPKKSFTAIVFSLPSYHNSQNSEMLSSLSNGGALRLRSSAEKVGVAFTSVASLFLFRPLLLLACLGLDSVLTAWHFASSASTTQQIQLSNIKMHTLCKGESETRCLWLDSLRQQCRRRHKHSSFTALELWNSGRIHNGFEELAGSQKVRKHPPKHGLRFK